MFKNAFMHQEVPPLKVWISPEVFFNFESVPPQENYQRKGKIFGVICEPGSVVTFDVITDDGFVFSNVPPHCVQTIEGQVDDKGLTLDDLIYFNCPSHEFTYCEFDFLKNKNAFVGFKKNKIFIKGKYLFSVDFFKDYNWFHCIMLENGRLCFMPSHKIAFKDDNKLSEDFQFPKFLKLRKTFSKGVNNG